MSHRPDTRRAVRTRENRRRFGSMPQRAEAVLQVLYMADGPVSTSDISDGLGWPNGITGGVLSFLLQQRQAVRISGGAVMWKLSERERERQGEARARG